MFRTISKAYGGGYRAGACAPVVVHGFYSSFIARPVNPYAWYNALCWFAWETAYYDGRMKFLNNVKGI